MPQTLGKNHTQNRLLATISRDTFSLFDRHLKTVDLKQGEILHEPEESVERVYFPESGMISLLVVTKDGAGIEAAIIGREGAVGLHRGLGKRRAFTRAVTQVDALFSVISAEHFADAVKQSEELKDLITRYTEVLWVEAQQIAACNAIHNAEERLCRWLLQTRDRIESDTLPLTQEFLSQMLGIRRTTVTLVARTLQKSGLIKYSRGSIVILDGKGLESVACECYHVIQHETLPLKIGADLPVVK